MVLVNAIYFKGAWTTPFEADGTIPLLFHGSDGSSPRVDMMHLESRLKIAKLTDLNLQVFELPYHVSPCGKHHINYKIFKMTLHMEFTVNELKLHLIDTFDMTMCFLVFQEDKISMIVFLPEKKDGLPALEQQINQEVIERAIKGLTEQNVDLLFPRFKVEQSVPAKEILTQVGLILMAIELIFI